MDDKTALVTGAGAGIGRAIAELCAERGASVVVTDIDEGDAEETVERIESDGGTATAHVFDVTDAETFHDVVQATTDEYGSLDVLFNNAGITIKADFTSTTQKDLDQMLAVNVQGVWNGCQAAVPIMQEQGGGSIVNTASIGGVRGGAGLTGYCLTKGGVVNLTRALGVELGPDNVRVNAICPGSVDHQMKDLKSNPEELKTSKAAMNRMGSPREIAAGAVFFGSDEASFITGETLVIDGGRIASE